MSVTTTLSRNQLAFIPVLSCSILCGWGGQGTGDMGQGLRFHVSRLRVSLLSLYEQLWGQMFPFHTASVLISRQQMDSKLPTLDQTLGADLSSSL